MSDWRTCDACGGSGEDRNDCEWLCLKCMGEGEYVIEYDEEDFCDEP